MPHTPYGPSSHDEVTLMASFTLSENARRAEADLRAAGFDVVQVSDASDGGYGAPGEPLVEWGRYGYQAQMPDDKWTTAAAWDNRLGLNVGEGLLLTAVVPRDERGRAATIIEAAGGRL
jgi:hypothetical protein